MHAIPGGRIRFAASVATRVGTGGGAVSSIVMLLFVASCLLSGGVAEASTMVPVTFEQASTRAELIVVGTVAEQAAKFNDAGTLILTHTTIDVAETIAGAPATTLEVSEYGGRVGDTTLVVPGMPRYQEGEQVLLFLCRDDLGLLRTCGATQGRLTLRSLPDGTTRASGSMAGRPIDGKIDELRARILGAREEGGR